MKLLLLSLHAGAMPDFLYSDEANACSRKRLAYIDDATAPFEGAPFVMAERENLARLGCSLTGLTLSESSPEATRQILGEVDGVYVAGGNTFALLSAMRSTGSDKLIVERVRAGLPYIGSSAGSIVAGPSIEPASLMDDPNEAPELTDHHGLGLVSTVVIPHADGALPPYPIELIEKTVQRYGSAFDLTLIRDDQALRVEDAAVEIVASSPRA